MERSAFDFNQSHAHVDTELSRPDDYESWQLSGERSLRFFFAIARPLVSCRSSV